MANSWFPMGTREAARLRAIAADDELLEVGRAAIEAELLELRDSRISLLSRGNGLVIRERDGKASGTIRLGPEDAIRIGLEAIAEHFDGRDS